MKITDEVKKILNSIFVDTPDYEYECARKMQSATETMTNESDKETLELLSAVMKFGYDEKLENPYTKSFITTKDDRSVNYNDFQDADFDNLEKLIPCINQTLLLARVAHVIWLHKKERKYAEIAICEYKTYFEALYDVASWSTPFDFLKRAYTIAYRLSRDNKKDSIYLDLNKFVNDLIERLDGSGPSFLSVSLIRMVMPSASKEITNKHIEIIDRIIVNACAAGDSHRVEICYDLKIELVGELGNKPALVDVYSSYAEALEHFACTYNCENMRYDTIVLYEKSVLLYRKAKRNQDANRVLKTLEPLKKVQAESMAVIPIEFDISKQVTLVRSLIEGRCLQEQLICLCRLTYFYSIEEIEKRVLEENSGQFIYTHLKKNILDRDGRTILCVEPLDTYNPKADNKLFGLHMHLDALKWQSVNGATIADLALQIIRKENPDIEIIDLDFLINNNILIPDDRKNAFRLGIYYGLKGDIYTALHLLAPQMENFFRELAKICGGLVTDFSNDGSEEVKGLTSIFKIPELIECCDESLLFSFEGMLNRVAGANIRNKIGHGIMDSTEGNNATSKYFFASVIKLLSWYSPDCDSIYMSIKADYNAAIEDFKRSNMIGC